MEYLGVSCVKMEISKLNNYLAETQQTSYWTMISYYDLRDGNLMDSKGTQNSHEILDNFIQLLCKWNTGDMHQSELLTSKLHSRTFNGILEQPQIGFFCWGMSVVCLLGSKFPRNLQILSLLSQGRLEEYISSWQLGVTEGSKQ